MTSRKDRNRASLRGASIKVLIGTAGEIVNKAEQTSSLFNSAAEDRIPRFETKELSLGHVIGRGGFCVVRELNGVRLNHEIASFFRLNHEIASHGSVRNRDDMSDLDGSASFEEETYTRNDIAAQVAMSKKSKKKGRATGRYVVKQVSDEIKANNNDRISLLKGIVDLWIESKYLASLHHPHIIKLRGMSPSPSVSKDDNMFIVLDCLKETFATKLKLWMHKERRTQGITGFFTGGDKKVKRLLADRLQAAYDIADAMSYLHSKNIVYRDLKPDNIGFDFDGNLKIFDFGLAKELQQNQQNHDGLYQLTAFTGAIRYMAPEVGLGKRYNLKADIYSWSILMWYIMALEPPFAYFTHDMITDRVFKKGTRPAIRPNWSANITSLLKKCWSSKISNRPHFHDIKDVLRLDLCSKDDASQNTARSENAASDNAV